MILESQRCSWVDSRLNEDILDCSEELSLYWRYVLSAIDDHDDEGIVCALLSREIIYEKI